MDEQPDDERAIDPPTRGDYLHFVGAALFVAWGLQRFAQAPGPMDAGALGFSVGSKAMSGLLHAACGLIFFGARFAVLSEPRPTQEKLRWQLSVLFAGVTLAVVFAELLMLWLHYRATGTGWPD